MMFRFLSRPSLLRTCTINNPPLPSSIIKKYTSMATANTPDFVCRLLSTNNFFFVFLLFFAFFSRHGVYSFFFDTRVEQALVRPVG
jgi:hypothetical protein